MTSVFLHYSPPRRWLVPSVRAQSYETLVPFVAAPRGILRPWPDLPPLAAVRPTFAQSRPVPGVDTKSKLLLCEAWTSFSTSTWIIANTSAKSSFLVFLAITEGEEAISTVDIFTILSSLLVRKQSTTDTIDLRYFSAALKLWRSTRDNNCHYLRKVRTMCFI